MSTNAATNSCLVTGESADCVCLLRYIQVINYLVKLTMTAEKLRNAQNTKQVPEVGTMRVGTLGLSRYISMDHIIIQTHISRLKPR